MHKKRVQIICQTYFTICHSTIFKQLYGKIFCKCNVNFSSVSVLGQKCTCCEVHRCIMAAVRFLHWCGALVVRYVYNIGMRKVGASTMQYERGQ